MSSTVPKRRDAGTYYTVDKGRFDALLKTMPAAQGILLFLELKRNYTHDGATLGELIEALDKCVGTIENTIYRLLASGEVVRQDGRFYPRDLHESFHNSVEEPVENGDVSTDVSTTLSTDVSTKLWKTPPKYTVLEPPPPPLKEKKELEEKEENIDPPTPQKKKVRASSGFDPTSLELPNYLDPQVWRRWCNHRSEIKKALTPTTTEQQVALLSKTPEDANAILTQSIERGWAGLFPLKKDREGTRRSSRGGWQNGVSDPVADKRRRDAAAWAELEVSEDEKLDT